MIVVCVEVSSSDSSLVSVDSPTTESHTDHTAQYPITLKLTPLLWDRTQLEASIEVKCVTTGQIQVIPVRIQLIGRRDDPHNGRLFSMVTVCVCVCECMRVCVCLIEVWPLSPLQYYTYPSSPTGCSFSS